MGGNGPQVDYTLNISLRLFFNSLSLLGSLFIIFSYLKFARLRKFAFKLICYLSISDLMFSIAGFLIFNDADEVSPHFCAFQGFALYYSSISTVFWTACIAYSLQSIVLRNNREIEKSEKKLLFVGYVLPILLAMIPLITYDYGPSSFITDDKKRWCGIIRIKNIRTGEIEVKGVILDWVVRFVPILLCFLFNAYMYFRVRRFFEGLEFRSDLKDIIKNKIKYFPLIPIFCWSMEIILRILELIYMDQDKGIFDHEYIVYVDYLDSIFEKSHGLLNALVYGFTQYVREEWRSFFRNHRNNSSIEEGNSSTLHDGSDHTGKINISQGL